MNRDLWPVHVGDLHAQGLVAYTEEQGEDLLPVFVVRDSDTQVHIVAQFGSPRLAAMGFERLAGAALAHAQLIRDGRWPERQHITGPNAAETGYEPQQPEPGAP